MEDKMTLELKHGIGYSGKLGERPYVALISGSDPRYELKREFIDADRVERDKFNCARYVRTYIYSLSPGLYEIRHQSERAVKMLTLSKWGTLELIAIDDSRLKRMLALLDAGETFQSARSATRPRPAPSA